MWQLFGRPGSFLAGLGQQVTSLENIVEGGATNPRSDCTFPFRDNNLHPEPAADLGHRLAQCAEAENPQSVTP